MRTLNVRLAVILLISGAIFFSGVYFLHGFQVRRNAYVFELEANRAQERAAQAADEENPRQQYEYRMDAVKNLNWYVRLAPDDIDALERLAVMMADLSQDGPTASVRMRSQAYSLMEMVLRKDSNRKNVRRRTVEMAMRGGRFQDAKDHLMEFLLKQSPDAPELWDLLGQCNAETGEYKEAVKNFKEAIALGPNLVEVYPRLASVLRYKFAAPKDIKEADQWMEKLIEANPKSAKAHFLRGNYLKETNNLDGALSEALKSLAIAPDNRDALWLTSQCYLAKNDFDKARECALKGVKKYPNHIDMYLVKANVELRSGNRDKAIEIFEDGLKNTGRSPRLLWSMADLLIDSKRLKEAGKIIDELEGTDYSKQLIVCLRSRISLANGEWLAARQGFERIRGTLTVWPELLKQVEVWIGQCYGQLGNRDQQMEAYRRALKIDPNFAPAKAGLTDALMSSGDVRGAIEEYGQLIKSGKTGPAALLPLARMMIMENLRKEPKDRNWSNVDQVLNQAEQYLPNVIQIPILRAEILVAKNRAADAESLLKELRRKHPEQKEILISIISLAEQQQDWPKADALIGEFAKESGDTVDYRLMQAQYFLRRYGSEGKERLEKLAEKTSHFSNADLMQLWSGLFNAAIQAGDSKLASKLGKQLAEKDPNNIQVRYALFEQALRNEDAEEMRAALAEVGRVTGQGAFWHYGQAVLLSINSKGKSKEEAEKSLAEAIDHLSQAQELRRSWSRIPLLMGGVYDQQGDIDNALKYYLDAIEMGERNPSAIRRAIQILFQKQRYAEADRMLRQLEKQQVPFSFEMNKAGAEIAIRQGEFERALDLAKKAAMVDSKNPIEHIWLGQMLNLIGRRAKNSGKDKEAATLLANAEKSLRQAATLAPELPATWVALIQFLTANNAEAEAEKVFAEAAKKIPKKQAQLALAQCCEAMNKTEAAAEKYEAALAASPDDIFIARTVADFYFRTGKPAPAEALLKRILDGKIAAKPDDISWARRQLAVILTARPGYQNMQKARALIEQNLEAANASAVDQRIKVSLDASDPQRSRRNNAIRQLESMQEDESASPEDRFQLAQMYLAAGSWAKANAIFRNLVTSGNDEPRYLVAYITALLDRGETASAELWLNRLEKNNSKNAVTVNLRAEFFAARGETGKALELLKSFVDTSNAQPPDRRLRIRIAAEKLEQLAKKMTRKEQQAAAKQFIAQAETFYRGIVDQEPRLEPVLAAFYARQGKVNEALDLLDRLWKDTNASNLSQLCSIILHADKISKEQMKRLEGIMQNAMTYFDRPMQLLMVEADLCTVNERYADAEACYREVLKKNSGNAYAMNNLAVLLALQGTNGEEALKLVNQAIDMAGPVAAMLDSRASVYTAIGEPEKALTDMEAALEEAETPVRLFHQAQAYARAGQESTAAIVMQKALEKGLKKESLQPLEFPAFEKLKAMVK